MLNRASPWLDVDSYLPVTGKVTLHIMDAPCVAVRLPKWCPPDQVTTRCNNKEISTVIQGRFLHIALLKSGDKVTVEFPVPERQIFRVLAGEPYKFTMRGSDVVAVDPPGVGYPLFVNQPNGELVKKIRFIPQSKGLI